MQTSKAEPLDGAVEQFDGKPLLAAGIVDSISELKQKASLPGTVVKIEPTGFEHDYFPWYRGSSTLPPTASRPSNISG